MKMVKIKMAKFSINDNSKVKKKVVNKVTKKIVEENKKNLLEDDKLSKTDIVNLLREEVKDLVKTEISNSVKGLTEQQIEIARDYAEGSLEYEIKEKHKLSSKELEELFTNESFNLEVKRLTYISNFSDKDVLVRANNRIIKTLFDKLPHIQNEIATMSPDKFFKTLREQMEFQNKLVDKEDKAIKLDVTQIFNSYITNKDRIRVLDNGNVDIVEEYPSFNEDEENIEEGEWNYDNK